MFTISRRANSKPGDEMALLGGSLKCFHYHTLPFDHFEFGFFISKLQCPAGISKKLTTKTYMADQTTEPVPEIQRFEQRKFRYSNEVTFEFEIDVSNPDTALVEIGDFIALMAKATEELRVLQKTFASKIEKPVTEETEKTGVGSSVGKAEVKEIKKQ